MNHLVLASASPRRVDLLRQLGLDFEQIVSPVEEPPPAGDPVEHAEHSARLKALAVIDVLPDNLRAGPTHVIGADTVVCIDETLLGKPTTPDAARDMLGRLSGREHTVCTGLAVADTAGHVHTAAEVTRVSMAPLSTTQIAWYVDSGEPLDKAGSYGIQGLGARFIERIEGCYYNVVGLPLFRLTTLLAAAGFDVDTQPHSFPSPPDGP